jgi:hypothetical protein
MMSGARDARSEKPSDGRIQTGYAVVTPGDPDAQLAVFGTFGERRHSEVTQAGVLASDMTFRCILYVNASGRLSRNLGMAIANPTGTTASVTLTLRDEDGKLVADKVIQVSAHHQSSRFVTELFSDQPSVPRELTGTLEISSDVALAIVGLRFRGHNFSTLPVTNLSGPTAVPAIQAGVGGEGAIILAHVATGGGWATEIVIVNTGEDDATVRVDLFGKDGLPMTATLNGQAKSSFTNINIPGHGVAVLSPRDDNGDSDF